MAFITVSEEFSPGADIVCESMCNLNGNLTSGRCWGTLNQHLCPELTVYWCSQSEWLSYIMHQVVSHSYSRSIITKRQVAQFVCPHFQPGCDVCAKVSVRFIKWLHSFVCRRKWWFLAFYLFYFLGEICTVLFAQLVQTTCFQNKMIFQKTQRFTNKRHKTQHNIFFYKTLCLLKTFTHGRQFSVQILRWAWGVKHTILKKTLKMFDMMKTFQKIKNNKLENTFHKTWRFKKKKTFFRKNFILEIGDILENKSFKIKKRKQHFTKYKKIKSENTTIKKKKWFCFLICPTLFVFCTSRPPYRETSQHKIHLQCYIFHCQVNRMCWMRLRGLSGLPGAAGCWFRHLSNSRYRSDVQTGPAVLIELVDI